MAVEKSEESTAPVLVIVGAVVVAVAIVVAAVVTIHSMRSVSAGTCLVVRPNSTGFDKVACDADGFHFIVGEVADAGATCESGTPLSYDSKHVACLVPHYSEGTCYANDPVVKVKAVECSDPTSLARVDSVHDVADASVCPEGAEPLVYTKPPITYCFVK